MRGRDSAALSLGCVSVSFRFSGGQNERVRSESRLHPVGQSWFRDSNVPSSVGSKVLEDERNTDRRGTRGPLLSLAVHSTLVLVQDCSDFSTVPDSHV